MRIRSIGPPRWFLFCRTLSLTIWLLETASTAGVLPPGHTSACSAAGWRVCLSVANVRPQMDGAASLSIRHRPLPSLQTLGRSSGAITRTIRAADWGAEQQQQTRTKSSQWDKISLDKSPACEASIPFHPHWDKRFTSIKYASGTKWGTSHSFDPLTESELRASPPSALKRCDALAGRSAPSTHSWELFAAA